MSLPCEALFEWFSRPCGNLISRIETNQMPLYDTQKAERTTATLWALIRATVGPAGDRLSSQAPTRWVPPLYSHCPYLDFFDRSSDVFTRCMNAWLGRGCAHHTPTFECLSGHNRPSGSSRGKATSTGQKEQMKGHCHDGADPSSCGPCVLQEALQHLPFLFFFLGSLRPFVADEPLLGRDSKQIAFSRSRGWHFARLTPSAQRG